jgi:rod shape-determining protein MreD
MSKLVWRNIGRFVLLMLLQLLVLNNVYLGGYVMPMLYVLFVLMLPTSLKRIPMLLIAFATGFLIDIMSGALGFHALACTLVAMVRILTADRMLTRGENVIIDTPSIYSVTPQYFIGYVMLLLALFYLVFFSIELFGFRGLGGVLLATVCSTVVTTMLVVLYQVVFIKRKEEQ